jgi:aminoglycoside/choline kinase family phosphotransferase
MALRVVAGEGLVGDLGERLDSLGDAGAGEVAGPAVARARTGREVMPRPSAGRRRFVESIIHDAFAQRPRLATTRRVALPVTSSSPSAAAIPWSDAARAAAFAAWIGRVAARHGIVVATLRPASSDASFRRYLRADRAGGGSVIVMDAPPPHEDVRPFVHVAALIAAAGLHAPRVLEQDVQHGFLLLDDLGSELYLQALLAAQADGDAARADRLMRDATAALVIWQRKIPADALPPFDEALLRRELELFPAWCVARECGAAWSPAEATVWKSAADLLVTAALAQPTVAVHRDWMPRNLMVADPNPGILDFQDAVAGPIAYDVASLLRDAFVSWDEERELDWAVRYWEAARRAKLPVAADFADFWRDVEWIGLQRHLKVLGIFARLKHRDAKPAYSADLPRFFAYAHKVATRYAALRPLGRLLEPLMGATPIEAFH